MLKKCPDLKEIKLCEFGKMTNDWLPLVGKFKKLESLDLSRPTKSFTDDPVIAMLKRVGYNMRHLDLSRHFELTDKFLLEGVLPFCPGLSSMTLTHLADFAFRSVGGEGGAGEGDEEDADADAEVAMDDDGNPIAPKSRIGLSNQGVSEFFRQAIENGNAGFTHLDLNGCSDLRDEALHSIFAHSGKTLTSLNIGGWKDVSSEALAGIGESCPNLIDLDIGWCRHLTDFNMKAILEGCEKIQSVKVWGM